MKKSKMLLGIFGAWLIGLGTCMAGTAAENEAEIETETEIEERVEYEPLDYVVLGAYKDMEVELPVLSDPTEEEIETRIRGEIYINDRMEEVHKGELEEGDIVNLKVSVFDREYPDGCLWEQEGMELQIGQNTLGLEGIDEVLLGSEIGSTVEADSVYPEDSELANCAGKEVHVVAVINMAFRYPELTDELAEELSYGECTTAEEYREYIRENLRAVAQENDEYSEKNLLYYQIENNATITGYPEKLMEQIVDANLLVLGQMAAELELEPEEMLKSYYQMTMDEYRSYIEENAQNSLKRELILGAVGDTEGIELTDEEFEEQLTAYAEQYGYEDEDELLLQQAEGTLRVGFRMEKILDWLMEHNTFVVADGTN